MGFNIAKFINSKDIREHLINIGYKFNSLEAAWLIFQCKSASIEEKRQAFWGLINTMPDCKIEERMNADPQDSLHAYLQEYMDCEDKLLNDFFTPTDNWFYMLEWNEQWVWNPKNKLYNTFESAQKEFLDECKEWQEKFRYRIKKMKVESEQYIEIDFDQNGRIMRVFGGDFTQILHGVFEGLWFEFPTPFQKGDIVWDPSHPEGFCGGPFVMTDITPEFARESTRKDGDNTDMNAWGYFFDDDGRVYNEVMWNYMDLELYRGELSGYRRILTAFSNYVKGDIDAALLCEGYHSILSEEDAKQKRPNIYTEKGLYLAGIRV